MANERSRLLPTKSSGEAGVFFPTLSVTRVALACVAVVVVSIAGFMQFNHSPTSRFWVENGVRMGQSGGVMSRFIVRTRCIPDSVKATNPNFFREGTNITGAMIVRHNLDTPSFFPTFEDGFVMTPVTYDMTGYEWDWEEGRFLLETDQVDWEWGFALVNSEGEIFYEIGDKGKPLYQGTCPDLVHFDSPTQQFYNRLFTKEQDAGGKVDYVFGTCDQTCPQETFNDWSPAKRKILTDQVKANTPNEVGSEFTMYGTAGLGVCQFDILAAGNYDPNDQYAQDRLLHFAPNDRVPYCHTNTRKDHQWSGENTWPDAWPLGPRGDPTSTAQWRIRIKLESSYMDVQSCTDWVDDSTCKTQQKQTYTFGYKPSDIVGIQVAKPYDTNFIRNDKCDFFAKYPGAQKNPDF